MNVFCNIASKEYNRGVDMNYDTLQQDKVNFPDLSDSTTPPILSLHCKINEGRDNSLALYS